MRFVDPTGTDYTVSVDGGSDFWFQRDFGQFSRFASGFTLIGRPSGGVIQNAAGNPVGTYTYSEPFACLMGDIGRRSAPIVDVVGVPVIAAEIALTVTNPVASTIAHCALGNCSAAGVAMAALPLRPFGMSNAAFGKLIGWTRGGTVAANLAKTQVLISELPARIPSP